MKKIILGVSAAVVLAGGVLAYSNCSCSDKSCDKTECVKENHKCCSEDKSCEKHAE